MAGFGTIDIKVRPIKIAFLVEPNNKKHVREAIQISSTLWGGAYCPIIPLYKRIPKTWKNGGLEIPKAKDVMLGYIDAFDPDILVQFTDSVPKYIEELKLRIVQPKDIWSLLTKRDMSPKNGIGLFEILDDIFNEHFKYKVKYPVKVIFPKLPKQHTLFWASVFGEIPLKLKPILEKFYFEQLEITQPKFQLDKYKRFIYNNNIFFPKRVTKYSLNRNNRKYACAYFMDVTKVQDIIDYWNLCAMGYIAMPIPKQYMHDRNLKELLVSFFKSHRTHYVDDNSVCNIVPIFLSRNSTMEELREYTKTIDIKPEENDPSGCPFFALCPWYPRVWCEKERYRDGATPCDFYSDKKSININESDDLKLSYNPIIPKFANKYYFYTEPRCANELSFRFYGFQEYLAEVFPRHVGENLIRSISSFTSFGDDWRIGRNGVIKLVNHSFSEMWEIPKSQKVFFAWLKDKGLDAKLSPPGILAKQIYKKLNGHVGVLRNETLLKLLEHMNGGMVNENEDLVKEVKVLQPRALPIGEIHNKLYMSSKSNHLRDYLVSNGLFCIGLHVQCPICVRRTWFSINQVGQTLNCPLCLSSFPAIGNIESGTWYYKTSGPFSIPNYADGAFATLLTLEFFSNRLHSVQLTPSLSFTAELENHTLEADFAFFWQDFIYGEKQEGIAFGECKTYGQFQQKDFNRMNYLAKKFPGAILIFSTLRKELTEKEIRGFNSIVRVGKRSWKNGRPINPVLILTGTELLNFFGPPYCWKKNGSGNQFNDFHGLIKVCDATQQIYLGLPSWQEEWNRKRKEKWNSNKKH